MRVAIAYEDGQIAEHFGRSEQFKVYEIEDGIVVGVSLLPTNGAGQNTLAMVFNQLKIETVICNGIGPGAVKALETFDIALYPGASGNSDDAIDAYLEGKLSFDSAAAGQDEDFFGCSAGSCSSCTSQSCGN